MEPFLTYSDRRDLREKVWRTYYSRGDNGDAHDNKKIIAEILRLRAERAKLLGFATHAHWRLDDQMAKTPERAMALMEAVWKPAVARVHEEVADMQAIADKEGAEITIEPWDYRYYAEKVRKAKYDLDENEVKPYLQLEKLREGMFWVAGQLFGFQFEPVSGRARRAAGRARLRGEGRRREARRPVVLRPVRAAGQALGRVDERVPRRRSASTGEIPTIVSNNTNFVKGEPGEPILISWDDATTLFHEFGHALHGLSSNVSYPSLAGTNVARDYVEFPSQLLERWLETPEVLNRFARALPDGPADPAELVEKIERASKFNQGFATVEYLAAALVDMKLHLAGDVAIDPDAFERDTLAALGMPKEIVMRHRTPQFQPHLRGRRLLGRLLQLPVGRHAQRRRVGGVHRGEGRAVRQGGREAALAVRVLGRQHGRPRRGLPRVPRQGRGDRRADAQARIPGAGGRWKRDDGSAPRRPSAAPMRAAAHDSSSFRRFKVPIETERRRRGRRKPEGARPAKAKRMPRPPTKQRRRYTRRR